MAVSAGYLLMTICRVSLRGLEDSADSENGPLMAPADWSGAKETEVVKESRPLASIPLAIVTPLAILGSTAHSQTLLMTPGYPVRARSCPNNCAVPAPQALSALSETNLTGRLGGGAPSAKLMMESIRGTDVSILCCHIFVGDVT